MGLATELAQQQIRPADLDITSLRSTLDWLRAEGYLLETDVETNPDLEITGVQKLLDGSLPILFNQL